MAPLKKLGITSLVVILLIIISSITTFIAIMPDVPIKSISSSSNYTNAEYSGPYTTSDTSIIITALGGTSANNVTLYYRYSANNLSNWYPGGDYLDTSLADSWTMANDSSLKYPQRLWYDEDNQLMYICGYLSNTLMIWNVTHQWDLKKVTQLRDNNYFYHLHDVKTINNWTYNGVQYGNIAMVMGGNSKLRYVITLRCNLSTTPTILDSFNLNDGGTANGYLDYFVSDTGHLIIAATKMSAPGEVFLLDASDPTKIQNITTFVTRNEKPWNPFFYDNGRYLLIDFNGGAGTNMTSEIYCVEDLQSPIYIGPIYALGNSYSEVLHCFDTMNRNLVFGARRYLYDNVRQNCYLIAYDYSDPEHWVEIDNVSLQSNGEWRLDYYTDDWAAVRHYIDGVNNSGLDFYNINNPNDMFKAGYFGKNGLTASVHMQWLDMKHNRGFFLAYTSNSFFALNLTVNLSHETSWQKVSTDSENPWSWTFDFPNGTGYYEFCTRGQEGNDQEPFVNTVPDARVEKIPTPSHLTSTIQTITLRPNEQGDSTQLYGNPPTNPNWKNVRDQNLSHYNYMASNDTPYFDLYDIDNVSYTSMPISWVTVSAKVNGSSYNAFLKIMTHNRMYTSTDLVTPLDGILSWNLSKNPYTNVAWAWEEINALQIGIALQDVQTNDPCSVYNIYATVFYLTHTAQ